eukprot:8769836-Alexandrium_andersonii.AAC.1
MQRVPSLFQISRDPAEPGVTRWTRCLLFEELFRPGETRQNPAEPSGTRRNPAEPGRIQRNP